LLSYVFSRYNVFYCHHIPLDCSLVSLSNTAFNFLPSTSNIISPNASRSTTDIIPLEVRCPIIALVNAKACCLASSVCFLSSANCCLCSSSCCLRALLRSEERRVG